MLGAKDILNYDIALKNLDSNTQKLRWVRTESMPAGWKSLVCDGESCKTIEDDSFNFVLPIGTSPLQVHFIPYDSTTATPYMGEGSVSLIIKHTENGNFITVTFFCKISAVGIKEVSVSTELKIFPNPVHNEIKLANLANYDVSNIEIYDLLGQRVRFFNDTGGAYYVGGAPFRNVLCAIA